MRIPWRALGDASGIPGSPLGIPWGPTGAPREPQERLRALKSAPRESNKRPKRARKRSEGAPRGLPRRREELLEDPKGSQEVPQWTKIPFQSVSHSQPLTAYDFLSRKTEMCTMSVLRQISETCQKHRFSLCFCRVSGRALYQGSFANIPKFTYAKNPKIIPKRRNVAHSTLKVN